MVRQIEPERNRKNVPAGEVPNETKDRKQTRPDTSKHDADSGPASLLPGQDVDEYQARIDAWIADYQPRNAVEERLVRHAADLSWKIDLAERQEGAIMTQKVLDAIAACEGEDAKALTTAATLASIDLSPAGERRHRQQFALNRDFLKAVEMLSKLRRR